MPTTVIPSGYRVTAIPRLSIRKRVLVKAYTRDRVFLDVIQKVDVSGFTKQIDSGLGECVLEVGTPFDSSNVLFLEGNHFEIWISDVDTVTNPDTFKKIYQGFVSSIEPTAGAEEEKITITLMGYQTLLGLDVLGTLPVTTMMTEDPDGVVTGYDPDTSPPTVCDIGLVVRGILTRYQVESGSSAIQYTAESVPVFSQNMIYLFVQKTYAEALSEVRAIAPYGTYSYLDERGIFHFRQAGNVTHHFVFGKDIGNVKIRREIEQVRNVILIWDGLADGKSVVYKSYEHAVSVAKYGRRIERFTNSAIQDEDTADLIATKFLEESAEPIVSITFDVFDNAGSELGYDIETINPGDTATFHNLGPVIASLLEEGMIVTSVRYGFDKATVTVKPIRSGILDIQARLKTDITNLKNVSTMPLSYTS
ncbi:MAG: hypothetical protein WC530_09870 [Candidatus Omnitrophota bacterium]|jgi:hypothetical protein